MPYATVSDVSAYYLNKSFTSNTLVTDTEILSMIDQYSAIIDARLSKNFTVPITDSTDLKILKMLCVKLVVCDVDGVFRANDKKFDRKRNICKEAETLMEQLLDGTIPLATAQKNARVYGEFNNLDSNGDEVSPSCTIEDADPTKWS